MNLQKLLFLIGTTVVLGVGAGGAAALWTGIDLLHGAIAGGFASATSLMGLWAYLTLNFLVRGFLPPAFWNAVQLLIVAVVAADLVYVRYVVAQGAGGWWPYVRFVLLPLGWAVAAAVLRAWLSGIRAFIPALFFMFVFTVIEWFPALRAGVGVPSLQLGLILLSCNTYLLLILRRLVPAEKRPPAGGARHPAGEGP
ncbi:MAG: KinB-signaling pathway activation protein [Alicyclobacillaceae bacterium]|nr:KinB-signaling pathway activation protein [Alicyclobacillaceae bacterium]